jgi:protein TonB
MKKNNHRHSLLKITLALAVLATPLVASAAKSPEKSYVESYQGRTDIPVPVSVVMPDVPSRYAGQIVEVLFVVTETGKLQQLSFRQPVDPELANAVVDAVMQWRFAPAKVDGVPVARRVLLPLTIIDGNLSAVDKALAMK